DLHPGQYRLTVYPSSGPGTNLSFTPSSFGTGLLTITDRDEAQIAISPKQQMDVNGEAVADPPLPGNLQIALQPLTRTAFATERTPVRVNIPGTFTLKGAFNDDYNVQTIGLPAGAYVKDITYGDHNVLTEPFHPGSATGDAALRIVFGQDGGTVSVKL